MAQTLDEQLRFAIAHKRLLEVPYDGTARIVEPHDYGARNGKDQAFKGSRGTPGQQHHVWDVLYARVE